MKFRNGRIKKYKIIRKVILSTMELEEYVEFGPTDRKGDHSRQGGWSEQRCGSTTWKMHVGIDSCAAVEGRVNRSQAMPDWGAVISKMPLLLQSCPTLCEPMDCSLAGSSVHGILQATVLEEVAMPSSRGSHWPVHRQAGSLTLVPRGKPKMHKDGQLSLSLLV